MLYKKKQENESMNVFIININLNKKIYNKLLNRNG